jgi:apolipoprotein N-acyltransferase
MSVIGTYSLNLLVISFFTAPAIYIMRRSKKEITLTIFLLLFPILLFTFSSYQKKIFYSKELKENSYTIRVIGSNISLDRFYENTDAESVINELIKLSSPNQEKRIFFLWPEGIIPNTYQDELDLYGDQFKKKFNKNHLIGLGITSRSLNKDKYNYFNSFSIFDNNLNLIENYNKVNLVPFGEFLPFENFLNKIGLNVITNNLGSFTKGDDKKIIQVEDNSQSLRFLPLICYEIIYSGNLSKNSNFDFIFNISEDGWFGKSIGPKQHFVHSKFRAIESGKYVVRSANNGMAAIINPLGEIEKKIDYGKEGFIDLEKRRDVEPTIFSIYGNKIFIISILLYIFLIFSFNKFKNE